MKKKIIHNWLLKSEFCQIHGFKMKDFNQMLLWSGLFIIEDRGTTHYSDVTFKHKTKLVPNWEVSIKWIRKVPGSGSSSLGTYEFREDKYLELMKMYILSFDK